MGTRNRGSATHTGADALAHRQTPHPDVSGARGGLSAFDSKPPLPKTHWRDAGHAGDDDSIDIEAPMIEDDEMDVQADSLGETAEMFAPDDADIMPMGGD